MRIKVEVGEEGRNGGDVDPEVFPSQCLANRIPSTTD